MSGAPTGESQASVNHFDAIIVGAGFAGLYLLHQLRSAGFSTVVLEAGRDIGGTWYWNRYPGARCDVHSLEYSYSFSDELQQDWNWSERYATQPEILSYINYVADKFALRRDIRLDTRVVAATFDEAEVLWTVDTRDRGSLTARFCIMATGCLSASRLPTIPGLESFGGATYHTANWPHEGVDLRGKRVGVIGTGSSGIQAIPCIAEQADHLVVFQRTPNYSVPAHNSPHQEAKVALWKKNYPALRAAARATRAGVLFEFGKTAAHEVTEDIRQKEFEKRWATGGTNFLYAYTDLLRNEQSNEYAAKFVRAKIADVVRNPETARKLTPKHYPIGTKRICVDTDYFATFNRENVTLVDLRSDPIREITKTGIDTTSASYEVDILVFATGFDAITGALLAIDIKTRQGASLRDEWNGGPRTYLGLAVAKIPNLFIVTGPGSPSVLSNMIVSIEHDSEWIANCLRWLRNEGVKRIEASVDAQSQWVTHVNDLAASTLYAKADSWYIGANVPGKPRVFMPYLGGVDVYQRKCREVAQDGYRGFVLDGRASAT
jgi:cyclohexanone monooxygenase